MERRTRERAFLIYDGVLDFLECMEDGAADEVSALIMRWLRGEDNEGEFERYPMGRAVLKQLYLSLANGELSEKKSRRPAPLPPLDAGASAPPAITKGPDG